MLARWVQRLEKIHHDLTRQSRKNLLVGLTVLAGMLSQMLIFSFDFGFFVHYLIGFSHSFVLLLFVYAAIMLTESIRLTILMFFVLVNMWLDLMSLVSNELHYMLVGFRYEGIYNFSDGFRVYEILCLLLCVIYICRDFIPKGTKNLFCGDLHRQ